MYASLCKRWKSGLGETDGTNGRQNNGKKYPLRNQILSHQYGLFGSHNGYHKLHTVGLHGRRPGVKRDSGGRERTARLLTQTHLSSHWPGTGRHSRISTLKSPLLLPQAKEIFV